MKKDEKMPNWLKKKVGRKGSKHSQWKGGRWKSPVGYIFIYCPEHPFAIHNQSYVREHRLVMEKYLGRYLRLGEKIHHKGIKYPLGSIKNKQDNRIENLKLFSSDSAHAKFHGIFPLKHGIPRRPSCLPGKRTTAL